MKENTITVTILTVVTMAMLFMDAYLWQHLTFVFIGCFVIALYSVKDTTDYITSLVYMFTSFFAGCVANIKLVSAQIPVVHSDEIVLITCIVLVVVLMMVNNKHIRRMTMPVSILSTIAAIVIPLGLSAAIISNNSINPVINDIIVRFTIALMVRMLFLPNKGDKPPRKRKKRKRRQGNWWWISGMATQPETIPIPVNRKPQRRR